MDETAHLTARRLLLSGALCLAVLCLAFVVSQGAFSVGRFSAAWFLALAGLCTVARSRLAAPGVGAAAYGGTVLWTFAWLAIAVARLMVPA